MEKNKELKDKFGKYFVKRNRAYNTHTIAKSFWDEFYKVIEVEKGKFEVVKIYTDSDDQSAIIFSEEYTFVGKYYEECTKEEFDKNYVIISNKINNVLKDKK